MDKKDKKNQVEWLHSTFMEAPNLFVTGFEKLKVDGDVELRKSVRAAGGAYKVIKNNLAERAAQGTPAEDLLKDLAGMTSMAYTSGDPVALAKALTEYAKANPGFTFKAGMVEGRAVEARFISELASLPSRDALMAQLLFMIQSPAQRLAAALAGVGRNLAVVVDQGCKENKFSS